MSQPPADGVAYAPDITVWLHPASKAIVASSAIVLNAMLLMPRLIDDWMRDARLGWGDHKPYAGDIEAWDVRSEVGNVRKSARANRARRIADPSGPMRTMIRSGSANITRRASSGGSVFVRGPPTGWLLCAGAADLHGMPTLGLSIGDQHLDTQLQPSIGFIPRKLRSNVPADVTAIRR